MTHTVRTKASSIAIALRVRSPDFSSRWRSGTKPGEKRFGRGFLPVQQMNTTAKEELQKIGIDLDPTTAVTELGVAEQQMVEIARALSENARFLLMDEPTASLTEKEIEILFEKINTLRRAGVAIVYISHRLEEIFELCDTVTVLRDGVVVATKPVQEVDEPALVEMMIGRPFESYFPYHLEGKPGEELLRVDHLPALGKFDSVSFTLRAGEIVGLAGLVKV